jgi:predicted transcriptional regulator
MPDEPATSIGRELATKIVSAYLRRNPVPPDQLASLISTVHEALGRVGKPAEAIVERTPAVPIRRSVTPDFVVCLECGWKGQMLRRHLTAAHGLNVEEYRARWKLNPDHPMTAPNYSERRSTMAKQLGLGRTRGTSRKAPEPTAAPRLQGRRRSAATST